jgi:hypothetical protein
MEITGDSVEVVRAKFKPEPIRVLFPVFVLPFPAQGNQRKYVDGLAKILRDPLIQLALQPTH